MISKILKASAWSVLCMVLSFSVANAQTFPGNTVNTAGNSTIPSVGTGGCTVLPQSLANGGTVFENSVTGPTIGLSITQVQINLNHTFTADLDIFLRAPNGNVIELTSDNGGAGDNYNNTIFSDFAAALITTGTAPFTGTFRPEGTAMNSCGTPALNGNITNLLGFGTTGHNGIWQLVIMDDLGGDIGTMLNWSISLGTVCDFTAASLPNLSFLSNDPAFCGVTNQSVTAPTTNCPAGELIDILLNGTLIGTTTSGGTFTFSGPVGNHVITYRLQNGRTRTQLVTITDGTPPTITCPSNVTINLAPGACEANYSYNVTATDNCPFFIPGPATIFPTTILPHGGGAITWAGNNLPGGFYYNLANTGTDPISVTGFKVRFGTSTFGVVPSPRRVDVWYTSAAATYIGNQTNPAAWTNVSTGVADVVVAGPNSEFSQVNIASPIILAPGQTRGIYMLGTQSSLVYNGGGSSNFNPINIGVLRLTPGQASSGPFIAQTSPRTPNVEIQYGVVGDLTAMLVSGTPSGGTFPRGTTVNTWKVTDAAGNMATCSFSVTVLEFPNPISSLACNDFIQISVDENCTAIIGADQILEGGPYGCYDDYIVQLDKIAPFGNGPWVPAIVGPSDIGKTYAVRVIDPVTGNSCWGNVKIEDKIKPVLVCPPAQSYCNADLSPGSPDIFVNATLPTSSQTPNNAFNGVTFDLRNDASGPTTIEGFIAPIPNGTHTCVIYYTTTANTAIGSHNNAAAWTLLGSAVVTGNGTFPNWPTFTTVPVGGLVLQPGQTKGIYIAITSGNGNFGYANGNLTTTDGNLTIISNNHNGGAYPFINANAPRAFIGSVIYQATVPGPAFPNGLVQGVNVFPTSTAGCYTVTAGAGDPVMEFCSTTSLCFLDVINNQACVTGLTQIVNRKWTAVDASGNSTTCIQVISVLRPTLDDIELPPNYDGIDAPFLVCNSAYPTPAFLESLGLQGYPYFFGSPDGCSIGCTYDDNVLDICDGTYKIARHWECIDWCTSQIAEHTQIIKVLDNEGPVFQCPANITVSTDPFQCCATTNLPDVIVEDACSRINNLSGMIIGIDPSTGDTIGMFPIGGTLTSFPGNNFWDLDTLANFGNTPCLPIGTHTVIYVAEDDCGNSSTCSFRLTIRDFTPPNVVCDEFTVVSIGIDDPADCYEPSADGCQFAGVTWVKATTFDDGSYDNCGNIDFKVQRMQPFSSCILGLNQINGQPACDDIFPDFPSEFERAISEGDSIKFYCCEVGTTQMVILRVYQLDVNGNFAIGQDGTPIFNECMVEVSVQDKIKPVCQAPANVTVSCENFDPSLWAYGNATVFDNCCLDSTVSYLGQKGLSHTTVLTNFDTTCNKGTITRRWTARDCYGLTSTCTQRVVVQYEQDYFVRFPNDKILFACDSSFFDQPTFFGEDCELLAVSYSDNLFTVVPDACYKIERTWTIINWCTYNPNLDCIFVPNPNPNVNVNSPQNLPGPVVSACGTTGAWAPTVVRINPTDPTTTNYCTFWDANANCYQYKQIIKVIDNEDPIVTNCPASPVEICDLTPNDPLFWNDMAWWDNTIGSHDLCEAPTDLTITATDACAKENISFRYLLFLDLDQSGDMETVISSTNLPGFNTVRFNNANTPNYTGGVARPFDQRPVGGNQKFGFALQQTANAAAGTKTAAVRWNTSQSPNNFVVPQLPYGTHKIKWFIEDGCGNETICEYVFIVKDCKAPTVVCINGLSVNIMPTQMISLWASDFLQYTEDNCTPTDQIKIGIRRKGAGTGFPTNPDGSPQTFVNFTCADLGTQFVELWGEDVAGNADYCETYVIVQDNGGFCSNSAVTVAGALQTATQQGLEEAEVELNGSHPALPTINMFDMSNNDGTYLFGGAIPVAGTYTVTPMKDDDHLNGVSTFDLVLINKHILGIETLDSPYKMIAADANNSKSITTFDIAELRKLILGIYTELPNNTSWRFVDAAYNFPNTQNPFTPAFPESKSVADVQASQLDDNFVSMKVGDVNGSAIANSFMSTDDRTAGTLLFDVEDRQVKAGEEVVVNFKASEKVNGYQFTMNFAGMEVVDVVPGADMTLANFGIFADAITTSFDADVTGEFTVKFRATQAGNLSNMLGVSSRVTKAEAYSKGGNRLDVAFRFNGTNGATIAGVGFELYQNMPNPFVSKTVIGFHLPEAAKATLTIFDEAGRMIYTMKGDFAKGNNAVSLDRAQINTTGVLYYKLETANDSATKKMIQTK